MQRVESILSRFAGGGGIVNDHVAFRTFGTRGFGIESVAPAFTDMVRTSSTAWLPILLSASSSICWLNAGHQACSDEGDCQKHVPALMLIVELTAGKHWTT